MVSQAAKVGGPVGGFLGLVADIATPLAPFSMSLTLAGLVLIAVSGYVYFGRVRKQLAAKHVAQAITQQEFEEQLARSRWGMCFATSVLGTLIMALFWLGGVLTKAEAPDGSPLGLLGNAEPVSTWQKQAFDLEKLIKEQAEKTRRTVRDEGESTREQVREEGEATRDEIGELAETVEEGFAALSRQGGIVPEPKSAAEHYHNAVIQIANGEEAAARRSLAAFLEMSESDYLDPHLEYQRIVRAQDGAAGARSAYADFDGEGPVFELARILLALQPEVRLPRLKALLEAHPEFGPGWWVLADHYDPEAAEVVTINLLRKRRDNLERFQEVDTEGGFYRHFLDKRVAEQWREEAAAGLAYVRRQAERIEEPVRFHASHGNQGWMLTFTVQEPAPVQRFEFRLGDGEFEALNRLSGNENSYQHTLNATEAIEITTRYVDIRGEQSPEFRFSLDPNRERLDTMREHWEQFGKNGWISLIPSPGDGSLKVYFTGLTPYNDLIHRVRYSIDSEALDRSWTPESGDFYHDAPEEARYVYVEVELIDGRKLEPHRVTR